MLEDWMCSFEGTEVPESIPVTMAKGIHLFPYRTQKLSLSAPMVLGWRRPGRVGRCRKPEERSSTEVELLFLFRKKTKRRTNTATAQKLSLSAPMVLG